MIRELFSIGYASSILKYTFSILKYTFSILKYTFSILKYTFNILKYTCSILKYAAYFLNKVKCHYYKLYYIFHFGQTSVGHIPYGNFVIVITTILCAHVVMQYVFIYGRLITHILVVIK